MAKPQPNSPYRLLVEGSDDQHVVIHVMKRHAYDWDDEKQTRPYVQKLDGYQQLDFTGLSRAIDGTLRSAGTSRLGIVVDADASLEQRWRSLADKLKRYGVLLPATPDPKGTLIPGALPNTTVGIWVMPDNRSTGALEHFIAPLVPPDDPCWAFADEAARAAWDRGAAKEQERTEAQRSKRQLYTWLAWQREPGLPPGTALSAKLLGHDSPTALTFVDWFRRLFPTTGVA
jgi:hypothetical protein